MRELVESDGPRFMRGKLPAVVGKAPTTAEAGRVCGARGCRTVLSVYNTGDRCWEHTPRSPYLFNIRRFRTSTARRSA